MYEETFPRIYSEAVLHGQDNYILHEIQIHPDVSDDDLIENDCNEDTSERLVSDLDINLGKYLRLRLKKHKRMISLFLDLMLEKVLIKLFLKIVISLGHALNIAM